MHTVSISFHPHQQLRGVYMGIAMMGVMHVYLKYTQPLFIQSLMGLKGLYDAKPVHIHVLGQPAEGDLKRPFKVASMFGGMFLYFTCFVWNQSSQPWHFQELPLALKPTTHLSQRQKSVPLLRRTSRALLCFLLPWVDDEICSYVCIAPGYFLDFGYLY